MTPLLAISANSGGGLFDFLHTMAGPDFLWLYAGWFALAYCAVLFLRWRGLDVPGVTIGGVMGYEFLGVARMIDGSAHGMHKWDFLIIMMILGGIVFFIRWQHFDNSGGDGGSDGGWWGSSSCSGGGGGCGGGGGGCGGCGGS